MSKPKPNLSHRALRAFAAGCPSFPLNSYLLPSLYLSLPETDSAYSPPTIGYIRTYAPDGSDDMNGNLTNAPAVRLVRGIVGRLSLFVALALLHLELPIYLPLLSTVPLLKVPE